VTSLDTKSIAAIERLIGQSIPRVEGDSAVQSDASDDSDRPREHRSREGSRSRKPRREREPRHAKGSDKGPAKGADREPQHAEPRHSEPRHAEPRHARGGGRNAGAKPQAPAETFTSPSAAPASRVPSIGRPEPRRARREVESEPADHSHLPAFLLRPVRARV